MEDFRNPELDQQPGAQPEEGHAFLCKWCQKPVEMSPQEVQWYAHMGFVLPTRCRSCRAKLRGAKGSRVQADTRE